MKIALIGYGKMGQLVEKNALQRGHNIVSKIHPTSKQPEINSKSLQEAQICIDFSHPSCILDNIKKCAQHNKSLVIGTTGWYDQIEEVKKIVEKYNIGFLYAPNFSIGVNLFLNIVSEAAALINQFPQYDAAMFEAHHNKKADSPSGTALAIAQQLLEKFTRKTHVVTDLKDHSIPSDALHISSVRCGSIPGTHSVIFDSPADTITLTHEARNREGFALGAVTAAEWLNDKKGFFTINDLFKG